jgi:hypothetical protein
MRLDAALVSLVRDALILGDVPVSTAMQRAWSADTYCAMRYSTAVALVYDRTDSFSVQERCSEAMHLISQRSLREIAAAMPASSSPPVSRVGAWPRRLWNRIGRLFSRAVCM